MLFNRNVFFYEWIDDNKHDDHTSGEKSITVMEFIDSMVLCYITDGKGNINLTGMYGII